MKFLSSILILVSSIASTSIAAETAQEQCVRESRKNLSDDISMEQILELCGVNYPVNRDSKPTATDSIVVDTPEELPDDLIETRATLEKQISSNRFAILQHKNNYVLPISYARETNVEPFLEDGDPMFKNTEFKFQLSLKFELRDDLIGNRGRLFAAYTNQSHWQVYNTDDSSPFRETNHEPEVFAEFDLPYAWDEWHVPLWRLGLVHQSNGRSKPISRSWNRLYAQLFFEKDNWAFSFKPWIRVIKSSGSDDNPDIEDFLGNFEFGLLRKGSKATSSALIRNNLDSDNKATLQLDWSYPIRTDNKLRFYTQYFNGYGESLIDYNFKSERLGLGFQLTDLL